MKNFAVPRSPWLVLDRIENKTYILTNYEAANLAALFVFFRKAYAMLTR
ncbi:protein of unknown function [Petrocella atlantisensis]|uniref:Uncharacterized protein n=1 Tax=Petrocella atlantisensis TaxID=2173034 RepID=A0A3P7NYN1_9FIRM|nr:protein of unknown function [Petrocella atlantisensis]